MIAAPVQCDVDGRPKGSHCVSVPPIALLESRPEWYIAGVTLTIDIEREEDGRWLAEVPALPGVMAYGQDRDEAVARVQALALRVIAERLEHREAPAEFLNVTFQAA
jgi:predicted RNase H-like HicB family nuclease